MSGGSYSYLYYRDLCFDGASLSELEGMVGRLEKGYSGTRAAINARALLDGIRNLQRLKETLRDVFQSVEWADSGDSVEADVEVSVEAYEVQS